MANIFEIDRSSNKIILGTTGTTINVASHTASRLLGLDASKDLESTDLNSWVTGTANRIIVTDDSDGTITLSTPQDIATSSSPSFVGLTITATGANDGVYSSSDTGYALFGYSTNKAGLKAESVNNFAGYFVLSPSDNDSSLEILRIRRETTETAAAGIGCYIHFAIQDDGGSSSSAGRINCEFTNAVSGSENSTMSFWTRTAGGSLTERMLIEGDGDIDFKAGDLLTTGKLNLRDSAIGIYSQADTFLDLFADGGIRIGDSSVGAPTNYTNFAPDGELTFVGTAAINGLKINIVAKTAAYTATATDDVITCGAGNETFTIDLPAVSEGKTYYIKNVGTGVITVDADTTGSTTIDGDTTQTVNQYECLQVISDASVYWAI